MTRFAIIEVDPRSKFENAYTIRQLVKAYITRVIGIKDSDVSEYVSAYRKLEGLLQNERANNVKRYNRKNFIVRSRSEALAATKLRQAYSFARDGKFDDADRLISSCKVLVPDYFELYRAEAFVAFEGGDVSRASDAFEAALDLDSSQPQLHFWYAGFISRALAMYEKAGDHYAIALNMDPDSPEVIRESIRNNFFQYKFEEAYKLIEKLNNLNLRDMRDRRVNADIEAQLFVRWSEFHVRNDDFESALEKICSLLSCLCGVDVALVDQTYIDHLAKISPTLNIIRRSGRVSRLDLVDEIEAKISEISKIVLGDHASTTDNKVGSRQLGVLKDAGRQEKYGFLRDVAGIDTFVHSADVEHSVWVSMCGGADVHYDVISNADGRLKAVNVRLRADG
ncbi:hypothetical protein WEU32_03045 [Brevundimonas sp. BH3]|uniref:tetratricopeptide repeat protein n=1 Tax=Brevundimonas sp. BH3 TaxID=3133089 RepID=UPI0032456A64